MRLGRSVAQTPASSRSFYWCQTSIYHEHGDGYWGQCVWRIAETGGVVQPLSGAWRLKGELPRRLEVSPLKTEDTGGAFQQAACLVALSASSQEDGDYLWTIRRAVVRKPPGRKSFLDPEPLVEVQMSLKQSHAGGVFRRQQRDMDLVAHGMSQGLEDLERAWVHLQGASEDLEEVLAKDRVLEAHKEMSQAVTHPLGHALRLLGARFNDLENKKRNHLAFSTANRTLSHYIRQTLIGFDSKSN